MGRGEHRACVSVLDRRSKPEKRIVVLIDEDAAVCEALALALDKAGYHVLTAEDARGGIQLVSARKPHAVILRIDMRRISACDATEFLRRYEPMKNAPLVVLVNTPGTAHRQAEPRRGHFDLNVIVGWSPSTVAALLHVLLSE